MPDLLYELGTEQLPASYIEPALEQLRENLERLLTQNRLPTAAIHTAGTPRRLTVAATNVPERQGTIVEQIVGPPAKVAFDSKGNPTPAAKGFAKSQNVPLEDLKVVETDRGPYVAAVRQKEGRTAMEVLPQLLAELAKATGFPKSMHWVSGGMEFARPIRWLVALFGDQVVPVTLNGLHAGRSTHGHQFLAPAPIDLTDASFKAYVDRLRRACVLVDPHERRQLIRSQINDILRGHGAVLSDEALLNEVTNLVEHPCALEGSFDEEFLELPAPVLTAAMKEHQRYFPVRNGRGELLPRFVVVSDRGPEQRKTVLEGNERVLRARLADARFFWNEDRKSRLEERVPMLKDVVFLGGLGDNLMRTQRLEGLCRRIAARMQLPTPQAERCARAAHLCKADLLTGLVGEFPSLQGVVGRELALHQGETSEVARAIAEHYLPAGADDHLPASTEGTILALADKLDVIVGCFSLGLLPTGSKDPYALRRNAQGILLILEQKALDLGLKYLLGLAKEQYRSAGVECSDQALADAEDFFRDRLYQSAIERGFRHDFVRAVLAAGYDNVRDFWARLNALQGCASRPWWPELVEVVDRTYRIQRDVERLPELREDLLTEPEEKELAEALRTGQERVLAAFSDEKYLEGAELYCSLFARKVHVFFDRVFVNVEDEALRLNRKSLCAQVYRLFATRFADLYLIEVAERGAAQ